MTHLFDRVKDRAARVACALVIIGHALGVKLGFWESITDDSMWDDHRRRPR